MWRRPCRGVQCRWNCGMSTADCNCLASICCYSVWHNRNKVDSGELEPREDGTRLRRGTLGVWAYNRLEGEDWATCDVSWNCNSFSESLAPCCLGNCSWSYRMHQSLIAHGFQSWSCRCSRIERAVGQSQCRIHLEGWLQLNEMSFFSNQ